MDLLGGERDTMCHHVIFDPVPPAVEMVPPFKYDNPPSTLLCPSFKIAYLASQHFQIQTHEIYLLDSLDGH